MPLNHLLLGLATILVWGSNFVVIKLGLGSLPPLCFATLRFALVVLPAVLFVPRPRVPWWQLAAYGLLIGTGQFGLLFTAMRTDISPGLASLVVQVQVFFTIGFSMWVSHERPHGFQAIALSLALAGLVIIAVEGGGSATPLGLALVILAGLSWAGGNIVARLGGRLNMINYIVWSSLFAVPPLAILSMAMEGSDALIESVANANALTWACILWQSVGNTIFGYGSWGWLLARHPAASVSPLALLIPIVGMASSALFLGEPLQGWKIGAAALVLSGLALNLSWPAVRRMLSPLRS
jgi:O-acetylserine/cysteine efflux transporter